jgi:hypothetical protein
VSPEEAVCADLSAPSFLAGLARGYWRVVSFEFPTLLVAIAAATTAGGALTEYGFRFELSNFPNAAPEGRIWDLTGNCLLDVGARPKGSARVEMAFQAWGQGTVYRPWDRHAGAHNNWATTHPAMIWNPSRNLTFIMDDLHGLLTSLAARRAA